MIRRFAGRTLRLLASAALIAWLIITPLRTASPQAPSRAAKRLPNLVFILVDQQRQDTMRVYGNAQIKTPNLNALAARSVVFERPYVTQPVCTPARASDLR